MTDYTPEWDSGFEAWTINYINKHKWRIPDEEFDDIKAECYLRWVECVDMYPDIDNQGWLMGVYKRAASGLITDLAYKSYNRRQRVLFSGDWQRSDSESVADYHEFVPGDLDTNAQLVESLEGAPAEVKQVLSLLFDTPSEVLSTFVDVWKETGRKDPLGNKHLCTLLGHDPETTDLLGQVRSYFN